MFWADKIAKELAKTSKPQLVDDAKTPSGRIHVGALRGVIIHDLVFKTLRDTGAKVRYTYIIDDMDPMDDLPVYLPKEKYEKYMGVPLKNIPAPQGKGSYADFYAKEFIATINKLGAGPEILWSSKVYEEGKLDKQIKLALDNAEKIQKIYEKISGSKRLKDAIPFMPICQNCGKIATTSATKWDGKLIYYECLENRVVWAQGCGFKGKASPYGGTGKLPWRVEWPAKWSALGVTVEGEGKDHSSKGGTRDTANVISREIFNYEPPYDIPYEHFLVGGKKMSSSKGIGVSAAEVADILPAEILRFLVTKPRPMQHLEFDPESEHTIPNLFDDFDNARNSKDPDLNRIWELSTTVKGPKNYFAPRFRDLINLVQLPNVALESAAEKKKGRPLSKEEKEILEERVRYVNIYLERFAPENIKFTVKGDLPKEAGFLNDGQKELLLKVADLVKKTKDAEKLQNDIYQEGKTLGLSSANTFKSIYLSLLGKEFGPKAAWLILSLDKDFIVERFRKTAKQ